MFKIGFDSICISKLHFVKTKLRKYGIFVTSSNYTFTKKQQNLKFEVRNNLVSNISPSDVKLLSQI